MFGPISETFKFLEKTSPVIQTFDWRTIKYMICYYRKHQISRFKSSLFLQKEYKILSFGPEQLNQNEVSEEFILEKYYKENGDRQTGPNDILHGML